jgi:hypothetical protein
MLSPAPFLVRGEASGIRNKKQKMVSVPNIIFMQKYSILLETSSLKKIG